MKVGRTTHTNEIFNIVLNRERFVIQIYLISLYKPVSNQLNIFLTSTYLSRTSNSVSIFAMF